MRNLNTIICAILLSVATLSLSAQSKNSEGYSFAFEVNNSFSVVGNDCKMFTVESIHGYYVETDGFADLYAYGSIGLYARSYGDDVATLSNVALNGADYSGAISAETSDKYKNLTLSVGFQVLFPSLGEISKVMTPFVNIKLRYLHKNTFTDRLVANYDTSLLNGSFPTWMDSTINANLDLSMGSEFVTKCKLRPYLALGCVISHSRTTLDGYMTDKESSDVLTFSYDRKVPCMFTLKTGIRF